MEEKQERKTSLRALFLCDVDGTLIHKTPEIDQKDVRAIQKWKKAGHAFGLVTGRDAIYCRKLLGQYGIEPDCLITSNGAFTYHKEQLVSSFLIDGKRAVSIYESLANNSDLDAFYTDFDGSNYFLHSGNIDKLKETYAYLGVIQEESVLSYLNRNPRGVAKISISMRSSENLKRYLPIFQAKFSDLEVMATSDDYIEMTQKGVNKAKALETLLSKITYTDLCFIGDGMNDLPLFETLENTYGMQTADSRVLRQAAWIVSSVQEALALESERIRNV